MQVYLGDGEGGFGKLLLFAPHQVNSEADDDIQTLHHGPCLNLLDLSLSSLTPTGVCVHLC